jgi:transposase
MKSNKNDANDAEAICEAMSRPHMRFVSVKSVEQQDIQATHRIREELKAHRNAKANQIRGLVAEYGLVAPQGLLALRRTIPEWLEDAENGLTDSFRSLLHGVWSDLLALEERLKELDKQIEKLARGNEVAKRLQQLRGVGPLVATALVATVGDGKQYGKGRQMASVSQARHRDDPLSRWVTDIAKRRHPNVAAVALAKKTARMAWAMLQNDTDYDPSLATS